MINAQKIKTNKGKQPEVHFNIPFLTRVLAAVTFLMVDKNLFTIRHFDEKVINLDNFSI